MGREGVAVLIINRRIRIPLDEFQYTYSRSGGPGGQNVNKVNTKVTVHWNVASSPSIDEVVRARMLQRFARRINKNGELVVSSQRHRDQSRNLDDCHEKIREIVLKSTQIPRPRKATKPTRASKERRLEEKRRTSQRKARRQRPED